MRPTMKPMRSTEQRAEEEAIEKWVPQYVECQRQDSQQYQFDVLMKWRQRHNNFRLPSLAPPTHIGCLQRQLRDRL